MKERKPLENTGQILVALLCVGAFAAPALGAISDAAGFLVQRDTDAHDPGGTDTNLFPNSNLLVNGTPLVGTTGSVAVAGLGTTLTIDERDYDNDPATVGFGANRTNALLADSRGDSIGLRNDQGFEVGVDLNLDAFFTQLVTGRSTRKEAGFRFKNPNDPAASSQFLLTTDNDMGEVVAFGSSGIFIPLQVFDTIDPAGFYVPGDTARLTFKFTPAGVNIITDPAQYQFTYDPDASGPANPITTGGVTPSNFAGLLTGTEMALVMQAGIADGSPDGDATSFANEFATAVFSNLTLTFDQLAGITGDFNNSGQVEQGDLDLVLQNWGLDTSGGGIPTGWTNDNDQLGQIEQTELDRVLQNWGSTSAPDFQGSSVPEPAALAGVLLGLVAMGGRALRQR